MMITRRFGKTFCSTRVFKISTGLLDYHGHWQPSEIGYDLRYCSTHNAPRWYRSNSFGISIRPYSQDSGSCNCGLTGPGFKCPKCGALLLPPPGTTFFDILEQETKYDLTDSDLKKIYRKLQTEFHPDKFSQKDNLEREKSEEISSMINKAYSTLLKPYERGMYLLELNRFPVNEGDIQLGSAFLAQIMEQNEELEGISTREELEKFENSNELEIQKLSANVSEAFHAKNFDSAKSNLSKMKYFISIRNRLKDMERNMV
uniref:J domain-containing protein n=1 Tax=Lygus hesperus TaxID=30085 RepID=A0A0K8SE73_LYGHE